MVKLRDRYGTITNFDQRYAKILLKLGKHKLVKDETASAPAPPVPQALPVPAAATVEETPLAPAVAMTSESPLVPKPKRTYRRRDMQAEE